MKLTPKEVGVELGISDLSVCKLIRQGELKATNVGAGKRTPRWRIEKQDVERFKKRRANGGAA